MMMATETIRVGRIEIFPIKSLDGISLEESGVTAGGILENDRVYAIVDEEGAFVNGKRTPRVHDLRCEFAPSLKEVSVWETGAGFAPRVRPRGSRAAGPLA